MYVYMYICVYVCVCMYLRVYRPIHIFFRLRKLLALPVRAPEVNYLI